MMDLETESRRGYTISTEMKKVWKVQLDLLKKLLSVCEQHHLSIWADGGTLLGTVREHGYIPWDDDIDMAMFRVDYDKLVSIAPQEFNHPFFFQCGYTEKYYPRGHAQLRMDGTSAIAANTCYLDTHQGIFIDIFPYDAIPDDDQERNALVKARNEGSVLLQHISSLDVLHPIRSIRMMRLRPRFHDIYNHYEDLFRKYSVNDCNNVACLSFIVDFDHFLRDKKWYENTVFMPFEDIMMPIPSGFHQILTKQYGDYMTPTQSPSYHSGFWKLDADVSYLDYQQELKAFCRRADRLRRIKRIKDAFRRLINR